MHHKHQTMWLKAHLQLHVLSSSVTPLTQDQRVDLEETEVEELKVVVLLLIRVCKVFQSTRGTQEQPVPRLEMKPEVTRSLRLYRIRS